MRFRTVCPKLMCILIFQLIALLLFSYYYLPIYVFYDTIADPNNNNNFHGTKQKKWDCATMIVVCQ